MATTLVLLPLFKRYNGDLALVFFSYQQYNYSNLLVLFQCTHTMSIFTSHCDRLMSSMFVHTKFFCSVIDQYICHC